MTTTRADFVREMLSVWDEIGALFPELQKEKEIAQEWLTKTFTLAELEQPVGSGNIHGTRPDLLNSRETL